MEELQIHRAGPDDLWPLLELYTHLNLDKLPEDTYELRMVWTKIFSNANHIILLGFLGDVPVSSCTLILVDNLTHGQRPYGLIENVITHADYRGRGYATALLHIAKEFAGSQGCYKLMLMTGSKDEKTLGFYRNAGYNAEDKTGFVQWL